MREHFYNRTLTRLPAFFAMAAMLALLVSCGDNLPTTATVNPLIAPPPTPPSVIALGTDTNFILTDNATAATLTATLVDASNALMAGVPVSFSATTGNLSAATATTDVNGQATVTLRSGLSDLTNRTANVTTSVGGQSASLPVLIKGSTLALALPSSNTIMIGAVPGTLTSTATAQDAAGLGRSNQTIRFSVGAASTGTGTLSATTLTTDVQGVTPLLTFTPTAAGKVVLTAEWLDSAGAVTVTATRDIIVAAAGGTQFAITSPSANPALMSTSILLPPSPSTQPFYISVPATINSVPVVNVRISSTAGTWTGTSPAAGPSGSIIQAPASISCPTGAATTNCVTAIYTAPANAGSVSVQVDALDGAGVILSTLGSKITTSATAASATRLLLAASQSTIVPSSGSNISTLTLEARVFDVNNNAVGGAPVLFGLLGTTGSGESVSPAVVFTDPTGLARTTFSAGSVSTLAAIYAQARVVGQACTADPMATPPVAESLLLCDTTPLRVSANAVSVTVGFGTTVADTANATQYNLPGSVLVVNSNGSAVAGATVTLSVFPIEYRNGHIYPTDIINIASFGLTFNDFDCEGPFTSRPATEVFPATTPATYYYTQFTAAEDVNRNGILESGEDTVGDGWTIGEDTNGNGVMDMGEDLPILPIHIAAQVVTNNGLLSPPQAAGGAVPLTVTTDSNGAATFFLQYPKSSAWFIKDEVTARVIVSGTESTAKMSFELPMSEPDADLNICPLGREGSY